MKKIGFIPLRAGSKGILHKNVKLLCQKALFCWILDTVISSGEFSEIWVATDCAEVRSIVAEKYPNIYVFNRSDASAADTAPTIDVVMEFLLMKSYDSNDWFVLFQATSPFTSLKDINNLCRTIEKTDRTSAIACYRTHRFRWSLDGIPMDYDFNSKPRRQDYAGMLLESGAFYASKVGAIVESRQLLTTPVEIVEVKEATTMDIDGHFDFALAEAYAKSFLSNGLL